MDPLCGGALHCVEARIRETDAGCRAFTCQSYAREAADCLNIRFFLFNSSNLVDV